VKFVLVDRITELQRGERIVAQKALTLAEEYLADHFPSFPVLPGVLMLEAMVQASAWLVRDQLDFAPSMVVLKEARNITYKSFLAPGQTMTITANCKEISAEQSTFAASGEVDGREMLKGRFNLKHLNLADSDPRWKDRDEQLRQHHRATFQLLWKGTPRATTTSPAGVSR
jgi:3-hydroxyacyl-[acyl-carrier-protein] dehydratase